MEAALFSRTALKQYEDQLLRPTIEHCLADLARQQRGPDGIVRADLMALSRQMMLTTRQRQSSVSTVSTIQPPLAASATIATS